MTILKEIETYKKSLIDKGYDRYIKITTFTTTRDDNKEKHFEISGTTDFICKEIRLNNAEYNLETKKFKSNYIGYNFEKAKTFKQIIKDSKEKLDIIKEKDEKYIKFHNYVLDNLDKLKIDFAIEKSNSVNHSDSLVTKYIIDDFKIESFRREGRKKYETFVKVYYKDEYYLSPHFTFLSNIYLKKLTEFLELKVKYAIKL